MCNRCAPILDKPIIGRNNMASVFLLLSALGGFISVALGAFAAHGLRERLEPPLLAVFQTGVQYQMYHALALLGVALWLRLAGPSVWLNAAGWLFVFGVLFFSCCFYALSFCGPRLLGTVAPLGRLCFFIACTAFALW